MCAHSVKAQQKHQQQQQFQMLDTSWTRALLLLLRILLISIQRPFFADFASQLTRVDRQVTLIGGCAVPIGTL
ncbi:hypothetical protein TYRP_003997 [Tyrophagus putrescentiae]|nr:hypothetical protein TYRP_003997 [Tyrophagus putrescentiae]